MKILSLQIQGYKNLKDKTKASFDFSKCTNYVALIGLNGSGKSNVLEAISIIFSNLYQKTSTPFQYEIIYELNGDTVKVVNDVMTVKRRIKRDNHFQYLPANVITSYSGEELRMWEEIYFASYSAFFRDIKASTESAPEMLYINKFVWEYALLALLSSDKSKVKAFISEVLKIDPDKVSVSFEFKDDNIKTYPKNKAILFIEALIKLQNDSKGKLVLNQINSINPDALDNNALVRRLFYNLFIAGMPEKREKSSYNADKIIRKTTINFNGIDVKKLSEGEKKLILINCITHLLADEKTLILLDEPDAHIHIERKKEIVEIIDQPNLFTIFTTHSPKILHSIKDENVRIIKTTEVSGLEAIYLDKAKALENLTNGEFSIVDATLALSTTKDILLVEGEYDFLYINEAINRLNKIRANKYLDFNFTIINCGGAGNVPAIFKEIIAPNLIPKQVCIATFDGDQAGKDGIKGIDKILSATPMANVGTMLHTPISGWDATKEFFMEDYFPVAKYKKILVDDINSKTKIKDFQQLSKDTAKSIIYSNYKSFDDTDYSNFEVLLDGIIKLRTNLKKPKVSKVAVKKAVAKKAAIKKPTKKTVKKK